MSDDESEYSDVEDEKVSVDEPEEDEKTAVEWKNIGESFTRGFSWRAVQSHQCHRRSCL